MLDEMNFSEDDFIRSNWREVIAPAKKRICESYSTLFRNASEQASEAGHVVNAQIFLLLHAVSSMMLKPEEKHQPFVPFWQSANGSRSADIVDFGEAHILLLKVVFDQIDDLDLRARLGDVIWMCQHLGNHHYAEAAIDAYILSGEAMIGTEHNYFAVERFVRAVHLAASLGRQSTKFKEAIARVGTIIDQNIPEDGLFAGHLLDLLYKFRYGDPEKFASYAETLAESHQQNRAWHIARVQWGAAAQWRQLSGNLDSAQSCRLKAAECYVFEAEDSLKNSSGMRRSVASYHLQSAIEALRRIPGTEIRQKELHSQMLQLQETSRNELSSFSQEVDLTKHVEKAIHAIEGKPFLEALFAFCLLGSSPNVKDLQDYVEENAAKHPITSWVSTNIIDERGRVVGRRGSLFSGSPEEIEAAKIAEMHRQACYGKDALAVILNAARLQLLAEHNFQLHDFLELAASHPFIPPGRDLIYSRGFLAGFQGNFLESLHLLIPQVENSLRYVLNNRGIITSRLSAEGIQEEIDLNALLDMPELKVVFGENIVFDLQGILISRFGNNFRNLMAHGLLDQQSFFSYPAIYIWWMILRLCCLPLIAAQRHEENTNDATTA